MKLLNLILCLVILGFSQAASAQNIKTTTQKFEGNTVSIIVQVDTIMIIDPVTDESVIRFEKREKIQTLNGKDIYYDKEAREPVGGASQNEIKSFISGLVNEDLKKGEDIHNMDVIIDENGNLGFLRFQFIQGGKGSENKTGAIRKKIMDTLRGVKFIPAQRNGKAVPYGTAIMVVK